MYMSVVDSYIDNTDEPCWGDLYTPCYIIVILIAWGSERFYLLVI